MKLFRIVAIVTTLTAVSWVRAADPLPASIGWRGNQTGLFPEAKVPTEWSLVSTGALEGLTSAPANDEKDAAPVEGGLVTRWLAIGPFPLQDGTAEFGKELVPGEATLEPNAGDKVGELEWSLVTTGGDGVSFKSIKAAGKGKRNEGALATACLFARTAGKLRGVIEHPVQAKIFVNGKEVYANQKAASVMGSAYAQSNNRADMTWPVAPSFEFDVKQGLNRITVKLVSPNKSQWNDLQFMLRLGDVADVKYQRKNILWETPLPDHGHGAPIVIGDRIFVTSEPDEILCIDRNTGRILWSATNTFWDAADEQERAANPLMKEKVEPLANALAAEKDPVKRWEARKKLYDALKEIDKEKYTLNFDGHLKGHFDIVGFTNTPVSDGKCVYFWNGAGVAACFEVDGKRRWIRRLEAEKLFYSAAPAVIDGKLAVYFNNKMHGLNADTGETAWEQPEVDKTNASLLSARIAGVNVFVSQQGEIVRASDGKMLWKNPHKIKNDTGWAPPTVIGDVMYMPWYGTSMIWAEDFSACSGEEWKPAEHAFQGFGSGFPALPKAPLGIPRNQTAGSPLIYDGCAYVIDWCGGYYVYDLKTSKTLAYREIGLKGDANYVAMPVAASCTLMGKHIFVMDNQGATVVLEAGGECKVVATNHINMQIARDWPITTREYTAYAPPVTDGSHIFIRGERHLYCIGETGGPQK